MASKVTDKVRRTGGHNKTSNVRGNLSDHAKTKPPSNFRDKVYSSLPRYSGVYPVGMMDIEIPVKEPRTFSDHITRKKIHILELETVLFSLYYPSALGSGAGPDPAGRRKWNRHNWLSRPREVSVAGYAKFAGLPKWPMMAFFLSTTWFTLIPAYRNAQLACHWPPEHNARHEGNDIKRQAGEPPPGEGETPIFPVLVFSHGLGGSRTSYSSVCGEFASYGFIVIAMEHRDGSGARTLVNHSAEGHGSRAANEGKVDHQEKDYKRTFDKVDYTFPKDNPRDTDPNNEKGVDWDLRAEQMKMRKEEIKEVRDIMYTIWRGDGETIAKQNLRQAGYPGSSSRGLQGVDWSKWKERFHTKQITMLGHSFGAATTVEILRDTETFPEMSQGILYDIWGGPVPTDAPAKIRAPLLSINSEAFMYWEKNFQVSKAIIEEAQANGALSWLMTVRGSIHISQSDFHLLYPRTCHRLLGATVNPRRAIAININASLEFLKLVMPQRISSMNRGDDEGILNVSTLEDMPTEHKPDEKWIAFALKAPHDLLGKVPKRHRKGNQGVDKEVWMHIAPSEEELQAKGIEKKQDGSPSAFRRTKSPIEGGEEQRPAEADADGHI